MFVIGLRLEIACVCDLFNEFGLCFNCGLGCYAFGGFLIVR